MGIALLMFSLKSVLYAKSFEVTALMFLGKMLVIWLNNAQFTKRNFMLDETPMVFL